MSKKRPEKSKPNKKASWPTNAQIIRDLHAIEQEHQSYLEQNKPIMVTRFTPDGKLVRRAIQGTKY